MVHETADFFGKGHLTDLFSRYENGDGGDNRRARQQLETLGMGADIGVQ